MSILETFGPYQKVIDLTNECTKHIAARTETLTALIVTRGQASSYPREPAGYTFGDSGGGCLAFHSSSMRRISADRYALSRCWCLYGSPELHQPRCPPAGSGTGGSSPS